LWTIKLATAIKLDFGFCEYNCVAAYAAQHTCSHNRQSKTAPDNWKGAGVGFSMLRILMEFDDDEMM